MKTKEQVEITIKAYERVRELHPCLGDWSDGYNDGFITALKWFLK